MVLRNKIFRSHHCIFTSLLSSHLGNECGSLHCYKFESSPPKEKGYFVQSVVESGSAEAASQHLQPDQIVIQLVIQITTRTDNKTFLIRKAHLRQRQSLKGAKKAFLNKTNTDS